MLIPTVMMLTAMTDTINVSSTGALSESIVTNSKVTADFGPKQVV